MRVLHVIPSVGDQRGGPSRAVLDMVYALREQHVDAEIVATTDDGPGVLAVPTGRTTTYAQVPVRFFDRYSPALSSVREFAFARELAPWLWQHVADYDLVHVHALFSYASTLAMLIARRKRMPYVSTPHGMLRDWALQQGAQKKRIYLTVVERTNLNRASVIHFTADQEEQEAVHLHLRPPSVVVPHGLVVSSLVPDARLRLRQQLDLPADEPIILFLSRLHPVKGLDYLIPALGQLTDDRFTFVLAGTGAPEYEQEVRRLLQSAGMQARTRSVGFVGGEWKDMLLQGADLFVLTSHTENFGIAVLEALAVGIPVLVTPGVPLAAVVEERQFGYVSALDVTAIAAALRRFLHERQAAQAMGQRAQAFVVEHYRWERMAVQLAQVYDAILCKTSLPVFPVMADAR